MKLYSLPVLLASALAVANAQVGIYGLGSATHTKGQTPAATSSPSNWLYGATLGVYDSPLHLGPIAVGGDLRGTFTTGGSQHLRGAMIGPRVSGKAPVLPLRPYAQASIGFVGVRSDPSGNLPTHYTSKFSYGVLGGLDVTVLPLVDLRVIELGYNHVASLSDATTATNLFNLGAGIVIRLP